MSQGACVLTLEEQSCDWKGRSRAVLATPKTGLALVPLGHKRGRRCGAVAVIIATRDKAQGEFMRH